jgi:hypothetical protein
VKLVYLDEASNGGNDEPMQKIADYFLRAAGMRKGAKVISFDSKGRR